MIFVDFSSTKFLSLTHLVYQSILRQLFSLFAACQVQLGRCQNMRNGAESMEQHSSKLDDQNQCEEEHKHQTDRFELQVFFGNVHLTSFGF